MNDLVSCTDHLDLKKTFKDRVNIYFLYVLMVFLKIQFLVAEIVIEIF